MFLKVLRYGYRYGFRDTVRRLFLGKKARPSGIGVLCFLRSCVVCVSPQGFPLTFKAWHVRRLVRKARAIDIVLSMSYSGGAAMYLERRLSESPADTLTFVVRPNVRASGRLHVMAYRGGRYVEGFLIRSLAAFYGLRGKPVRLIVNELVTWQFFETAAMSVSVLERIVDRVLALRRKTGSEMLFLVHDYFPVCPRWTLVGHDDAYCRDEYACTRCADCLRDSDVAFSYDGGIDIAAWRRAFGRLLAEASEVRTFSHDTEQRILRIYPGLKTTCVPHRPNGPALRVPRLSDKGVVIGIFGLSTPSKGSRKVVELQQYLRQIGRLDVRIVRITRYVRESLPEIVEREGINVAFFSSLCPETFSFVTQELMMMRLPIVCFDVGAPVERVRKYAKGAVAADWSAAAVWKAVEALIR